MVCRVTMMGANSFSDLVLRYVAQKDYRIQVADRGADVTIVAIHAGLIEPLTSQLAQAVAGLEHNLYELKGLMVDSSIDMRIPTSRYSEMRLNALVRRSKACVSIDGVPGDQEVVYLGGKNTRLKQLLVDQLVQAGFQTAGTFSPGAAHDPTRYYNAARDGGVLIELSAGLRAGMLNVPLTSSEIENPAAWLESFHRFTSATTLAITSYLEFMQSDVEQALLRFEETTRQMPRVLRTGHHHRSDE
ncbi:MAG: poly-gamma-glutamate hydrolase family protein, partial [Anaerolineae bacterium]